MRREEYLRRQQQRVTRIDSGVVVGLPGELSPRTGDVSTAGRIPRTGVKGLNAQIIYPGDQVVMFCAGDSDLPIIIGRSPYIV